MACFISSDTSEIVPVKGAERFYKGRYLRSQSTATEGTVDYKDTVDIVDRKQKSDDILQGQDHPRADKDTGADHKTTGTWFIAAVSSYQPCLLSSSLLTPFSGVSIPVILVSLRRHIPSIHDRCVCSATSHGVASCLYWHHWTCSFFSVVAASLSTL